MHCATEACQRKGASEAESRLFQTLVPHTRRIRWNVGRKILITDTVGFIQTCRHWRLLQSPLKKHGADLI
jgi:50S ribosomal subunit-associated GTPase HflX